MVKSDDTWDFPQECVNKEGGVACACARGFLPHPFNTSACQDIGRGRCCNLLFIFTKITSDLKNNFFIWLTVMTADAPPTCSDECDQQNGGCDQLCRNVPGARRCDCRKGFQLLPDKTRSFRVLSFQAPFHCRVYITILET